MITKPQYVIRIGIWIQLDQAMYVPNTMDCSNMKLDQHDDRYQSINPGVPIHTGVWTQQGQFMCPPSVLKLE